MRIKLATNRIILKERELNHNIEKNNYSNDCSYERRIVQCIRCIEAMKQKIDYYEQMKLDGIKQRDVTRKLNKMNLGHLL